MNFKRLSALLLTILLVVSLFSTVTFASNGLKKEKLTAMTNGTSQGFAPYKIVGNQALTDAYLSGNTAETNATTTLPSRYDGRDYNYLPPVRNQLRNPGSSSNEEQTCWAFATIASVEAYMVKHGIKDASTGMTATTSINLSESHLAWFNYTNAYDKKGMLSGDYTSPLNSSYIYNTGHYYMSTYTLMRWEGVASENTSALKYSNMPSSGLNSQYAYDYDAAHLTKAEWIPLTNRDAVKRAIMEYGAGGVSLYYYLDYRVYNSNTAAYCCNQNKTPNDYGYWNGTHAVTVVGWDDNYSKNNFPSYGYGPTSNGAWIIRDSYGSDIHDGGYFYLSYEDSASYYERAFFYAVDNVDNFTNCYQYDGTANGDSYKAMGNNCQIANIFTASGAEKLKAVALATFDEAVSYTVKIYKNPSSASNPTSGTLMTTQNGYIAFPGYYTINLNSPVALNANDMFAVVFTLSTPSADSSGYYLHMPYDASTNIGWVRFYHSNKGNTSYYREANGTWLDTPNYGDFRIKAYTDPNTSTHTHSYGNWYSNNNGTHSRTCSCGDKQTANCTYTDVVTAPTTTSQGYTTHTCTVCGYSYKDNYTDPVAPTTYYTVTFSVPSGVSSISSKTVSANSYITLPTAGAPSGYTFKGWVTSAVSDTTTAPSYLTGSYRVTGNVTLRALYAYTTSSGGTGTSGYQLLTSAPSDWAGNYVITYGTASSSMYLMKGVSVSSNPTTIENSSNAVAFASTGASLSNNVLTNVGNAYIFTMAKHGSYYSVQNVSTGTYVGMNSSTYLAGYNTYTSTYCDWTPGVGTSASCMKSAASGSYPYLGFTTSSKYFWSGTSANTSIRLWKQTSGSGSGSATHYTTSPTTSGGSTSNYTVTFSVPSGVSAPSSQTVTANSYITLPSAGAPSGYTFLGWVTSSVSSTTTRPSYLTGSYKVTGNITLRALYSYTSTSGGSGSGYQLVTSAPSDWTGNYVISYGTASSSMYLMKGVSVSSNPTTIENSSNAVAFASTGASLSNNVLTNVGNAYVFKMAKHGSYYSVQNASTGTYIGMNSSTYLAGYNTYTATYCDWTLGVGSSASCMKSAASGSYPYLSFTTGSKYFWSGTSANTSVRFWKQTTTGGSSTTYYTTG